MTDPGHGTGAAAAARWLVDPTDVAAFADRVNRLLADPHAAERMGEAAEAPVRDDFLGPRDLGQYVDLFERVLRA